MCTGVMNNNQIACFNLRQRDLIRDALDQHPPPSKAGRHLKIYYGSQVRNDPPTFLLHVNDTELAHFTYLRYLENKIRELHPFVGTPIRIFLRPRKK